jgi:hypothetical protein
MMIPPRLTSTFVFAIALLASFAATPATAGAKTECYVKAAPPLIYKHWQRRDVLEPGVYEIYRTPPRYGVVTRKVMAEPGGVIWHETPAVYKTVPKKVKVGGGYAWKACARGEVVCKVRTPVRYEIRHEKVLVKPGRRYSTRVSPTYTYITERVLLKPYRNYNHFHRPHVQWSRNRVPIQPEGYRWARTSVTPDC